ncbi:fumarate/nitrate reduction transcriptional regulator Fnr [Kushneria phosphatilytica]|uniref:Fumarate/nitrate reduction transcriptional regulator Fnr n=1 Tax=Kushneria phosphatilytica TaxID=657387 RepID=A0A1S1NRN4_9GAMM|nr:fumarate/nitrate reduction transcriptional regulator Fnr [Kushneria phosphatilytica]OHV07589.1 Crp/Fnr family transcriptional regulator [Kushneria phosphatilytica]QEL10073.1 fumarate/nitrate reduction transcriptional regulator Fnr [Kushneria phosphatilytica]
MTIASATPYCSHGAHCQTCSLSSLCLPVALKTGELDHFDAIIKRRPPLATGDCLFRQGDHFSNVYAIRSGSLKQVNFDHAGNEQITHFFLPGELVGFDGIDDGYHTGYAHAMEKTCICEIPFSHLETLAERIPQLRSQLFRSMSREMKEDHRLIRLLSCKTADERIAGFLINLAVRFQRCGHSSKTYRLPMTRTDISNHLGLALETVSRVLKRFRDNHLVAIRGRDVQILQPQLLYELAENGSP